MRVDRPSEIFAPESYRDCLSQTTADCTGNSPINLAYAWNVSPERVFLLEWITLFYSYTKLIVSANPLYDMLSIRLFAPQLQPPNALSMKIYCENGWRHDFNFLTCFNPGSKFYLGVAVTRNANPDASLGIIWKGRTWDDKTRAWTPGEKLAPASATKTWEV